MRIPAGARCCGSGNEAKEKMPLNHTLLDWKQVAAEIERFGQPAPSRYCGATVPGLEVFTRF